MTDTVKWPPPLATGRGEGNWLKDPYTTTRIEDWPLDHGYELWDSGKGSQRRVDHAELVVGKRQLRINAPLHRLLGEPEYIRFRVNEERRSVLIEPSFAGAQGARRLSRNLQFNHLRLEDHLRELGVESIAFYPNDLGAVIGAY